MTRKERAWDKAMLATHCLRGSARSDLQGVRHRETERAVGDRERAVGDRERAVGERERERERERAVDDRERAVGCAAFSYVCVLHLLKMMITMTGR